MMLCMKACRVHGALARGWARPNPRVGDSISVSRGFRQPEPECRPSAQDPVPVRGGPVPASR